MAKTAVKVPVLKRYVTEFPGSQENPMVELYIVNPLTKQSEVICADVPSFPDYAALGMTWNEEWQCHTFELVLPDEIDPWWAKQSFEAHIGAGKETEENLKEMGYMCTATYGPFCAPSDFSARDNAWPNYDHMDAIIPYTVPEEFKKLKHLADVTISAEGYWCYKFKTKKSYFAQFRPGSVQAYNAISRMAAALRVGVQQSFYTYLNKDMNALNGELVPMPKGAKYHTRVRRGYYRYSSSSSPAIYANNEWLACEAMEYFELPYHVGGRCQVVLGENLLRVNLSRHPVKGPFRSFEEEMFHLIDKNAPNHKLVVVNCPIEEVDFAYARLQRVANNYPNFQGKVYMYHNGSDERSYCVYTVRSQEDMLVSTNRPVEFEFNNIACVVSAFNDAGGFIENEEWIGGWNIAVVTQVVPSKSKNMWMNNPLDKIWGYNTHVISREEPYVVLDLDTVEFRAPKDTDFETTTYGILSDSHFKIPFKVFKDGRDVYHAVHAMPHIKEVFVRAMKKLSDTHRNYRDEVNNAYAARKQYMSGNHEMDPLHYDYLGHELAEAKALLDEFVKQLPSDMTQHLLDLYGAWLCYAEYQTFSDCTPGRAAEREAADTLHEI